MNDINKCLEDQNGKCFFQPCKNGIKYIVKGHSPFTYQVKLFGLCEKHLSEHVKIKPKRDTVLGI